MLELTPETFSLSVEETANYMKDGYLEAILHLCNEYNIEPEFASKLLSKPIIEKLHNEGIDLNILPKTAKLPV
tara:strand:- start:387 stop:605 length:219 start_codon:yes stop_codon:yes gene_type:complete